MIRQDTGGILRVFGMYLLVGLVIGIALSIVFSIVFMFVIFAGLARFGGLSDLRYMREYAIYSLIFSAGGVVILITAILGYLACVAQMFLEMLTARALGYWTGQFDVPQWRGQDDPMPFELQPAVGQQAPAQAYYGQPQQQPEISLRRRLGWGAATTYPSKEISRLWGVLPPRCRTDTAVPLFRNHGVCRQWPP